MTARKQSVISQSKLKERLVNKGGGYIFSISIHPSNYIFSDGILRNNWFYFAWWQKKWGKKYEKVGKNRVVRFHGFRPDPQRFFIALVHHGIDGISGRRVYQITNCHKKNWSIKSYPVMGRPICTQPLNFPKERNFTNYVILNGTIKILCELLLSTQPTNSNGT